MVKPAVKTVAAKKQKPSANASAKKRSPAPSRKKLAADEQLSLNFYRQILEIRRFEERVGQLYGMGKIGGFCHLYIGQEAVVVGIQHALAPGDSVITGYRDHGHMLVCGMDAGKVMAELTGRQAGYSRGKGGSMHMFSPEQGFFGGQGIVGAQVSLGTGLAFAHRYRGDDHIAVVYMGDGAVNQGQVYESMNIASLWNLPVLYVIENNKYGMGTSTERAAAGERLADRGLAYGIPGVQVDGMSVFDVAETAQSLVDKTRKLQTPHILEAMTYRFRGHSMSDPAKYRSRDELDNFRNQQDPVNTLRAHLLDLGIEEEKLRDIDKDIRAKMAQAAEFAVQDPEPDPAELTTDVWIETQSDA